MRLCARHRLRRLRPEGRALAAAFPVFTAFTATILVKAAAEATPKSTTAAADATPAAAKSTTAAAATPAAPVAPASRYASWDAMLEFLQL